MVAKIRHEMVNPCFLHVIKQGILRRRWDAPGHNDGNDDKKSNGTMLMIFM